MGDERTEPLRPEVDKPATRLKDVDSAERARLIYAFSWLIPAVVVIGVFAGIGASQIAGLTPLQSLATGLAVTLGGVAFFYIVVYGGLIGGTVSLFGRLYGLGSSGSPSPQTYWRAETASARGRPSQALEALEAAALEDPDDPRPCLRAAALCLEELNDPELAIQWYRRAQSVSRLDPETAAFVSVRMAEAYESMEQDGQAMVELRRLLTVYPESQYTSRARARLADLKARRSASDR